MSKSDYRSFFAQCKPYIKLSRFANMAGIHKSTLSLFMKSDAYDYCISLDRLCKMYTLIVTWCDDVA